MVIELTDDNFRQQYESKDIIVVDFWASWCGPCRAFAPVFESVSEKFPEVSFGTVNTETEAKLAAHFSVRSVPTVMIIREGLEVFYQPGGLSEDDLIKLIHEAKKLDMDIVKKEADSDSESVSE